MTFQFQTNRHQFMSARDAIDAMSAFETSTTEDWEYQTQCIGYDDDENSGGYRYVVRLKSLVDPKRGYLAPADQDADQ
jgi:hypothetical protein